MTAKQYGVTCQGPAVHGLRKFLTESLGRIKQHMRELQSPPVATCRRRAMASARTSVAAWLPPRPPRLHRALNLLEVVLWVDIVAPAAQGARPAWLLDAPRTPPRLHEARHAAALGMPLRPRAARTAAPRGQHVAEPRRRAGVVRVVVAALPLVACSRPRGEGEAVNREAADDHHGVAIGDQAPRCAHGADVVLGIISSEAPIAAPARLAKANALVEILRPTRGR
mmetsp:Transcript_91130/g.262830  ORF Transcript_91130/g.262830 Transcript_91130/m.262830 type:complete len:225 (+) Transcript_91130:70-744(+)